MSRNDSILHTGMTSASMTPRRSEEVSEKRKQAAQERDERSKELKPVAKPILDALTAERDQTTLRLLSLVAPGTPDEDVKNLLISLNLYKDSMAKLETRLKIILKDVA